MRIGYPKELESRAEYLRQKGYDVAEYQDGLFYDVLLYGQAFDPVAFTGQQPAANDVGDMVVPPLFLLNVDRLDDEQMEEQVRSRTYSKLFE